MGVHVLGYFCMFFLLMLYGVIALLSKSAVVMHANSHATHARTHIVVHAVHDNLSQVAESAQVCMA